MDNDVVHIDPQLLFQRLLTSRQATPTQLQEVLSYELTTAPSSLFEGLRCKNLYIHFCCFEKNIHFVFFILRTGDIFTLYLGTTRVIVLSSYDIMKEALIKQADFTSDRPKKGLLTVLDRNDGIIETSGPLWKENRTVVLTLLREFGMGKNVMAEKIEEE
ncbi:cytochrome P450 2U1, partial [Elysia marginata]